MDPGADHDFDGTVRRRGEDSISLVEVATAVLRNRRLVIVLPLLLAVLAAGWRLSRERTYTATASFLPQSTEAGRAGGAASLAQQFGVNLGLGQSGQSPEFYVDLIRAQTILGQAVESEYAIRSAAGRARSGTLMDFYDLEEDASEDERLRRAIRKLDRSITVSVERATGVVKLSVSAPNAELAEQVGARLLELLDAFNRGVLQQRAEAERLFINERLEEAADELRGAERRLEEFLARNREFRNSPDLIFEHDRLQRQVAMRQEVYTSLMRSVEQAGLDAVRDTPMITVIDHPSGTAEPDGRGTVMAVVVAFMIGLMIAVFTAFVREVLRRERRMDRPSYDELQGLAREAWEDVRRPTRWLRHGEETVPAGDR